MCDKAVCRTMPEPVRFVAQSPRKVLCCSSCGGRVFESCMDPLEKCVRSFCMRCGAWL
jgi:hypothetical protein